jgi:hypothetical protein
LFVTIAPLIVSKVRGAIVHAKLALLVPNALIAVIVAVPLPAVVGTPLIKPLVAIASPAGRLLPPNVIGAVPLAVTG